jgi:hypothetical protein
MGTHETKDPERVTDRQRVCALSYLFQVNFIPSFFEYGMSLGVSTRVFTSDRES